MTRFTSSRSYLILGILSFIAAAASTWFAFQWPPSWFAVVLFFLTGCVLLALSFRPPIRITDDALKLGSREIPWSAIRRIEHRGWLSPLIVRLTLADDSQTWVIYPGDADSSQTLLQFLYRFSDNAAPSLAGTAANLSQPVPRYPLLRPEDEEEVERLYHRLRSVGHLDPRSSDEE